MLAGIDLAKGSDQPAAVYVHVQPTYMDCVVQLGAGTVSLLRHRRDSAGSNP